MCGCGTVCNLVGGVTHPDTEPRVYGGLQRDVEVLDGVVNGAQSNPQMQISHDPRAALILVPVGIADPILSFVGDTLTLPITIPLQRRRIANSEDGQDSRASSADPQSEIALEKPVPIDSTSQGVTPPSDSR